MSICRCCPDSHYFNTGTKGWNQHSIFLTKHHFAKCVLKVEIPFQHHPQRVYICGFEYVGEQEGRGRSGIDSNSVALVRSHYFLPNALLSPCLTAFFFFFWHDSIKFRGYYVFSSKFNPTSGFGTKARPGMVKQLWTVQRYWAIRDRRLLCLLPVLAVNLWMERTTTTH